MTKDTIFLILPKISSRNYRIYEYVEENETLKWHHLANFGNMVKYRGMLLPEVIKPMDKGKFIFFPRETVTRFRESFLSFDIIELWVGIRT